MSALSFSNDLDDSDDPVLAGVESKPANKGYFMQLLYGFVHFGESIWLGIKIVLGHRRFMCAYSRSIIFPSLILTAFYVQGYFPPSPFNVAIPE